METDRNRGVESAQSVMARFYKIIKDEYPHLNYSQYKEIIELTWREARNTIKEGNLENFRIQFFGEFRIRFPKLVYTLEELRVLREEGRATQYQLEFLERIEKPAVALLKRKNYDEKDYKRQQRKLKEVMAKKKERMAQK